jgi:hypothetical protein
MPANYQSSMAFPAAGADVFRACMSAVPQCGFRVLSSNPESGQIDARAGMGFRSWGENIVITVSAEGRADVKSSCRGFQVVDYGKNKANVEALFSALTTLLPPQPQPQ